MVKLKQCRLPDGKELSLIISGLYVSMVCLDNNAVCFSDASFEKDARAIYGWLKRRGGGSMKDIPEDWLI